jgi:hypothetical protein
MGFVSDPLQSRKERKEEKEEIERRSSGLCRFERIFLSELCAFASLRLYVELFPSERV